MNRKQLIILLVLVVVVGGAGLLVLKKQESSYSGGGAAAGKNLLPGLAVNDIIQITLKQDTNELNLAKKDDLWRVAERKDYPANYSEISDFLIKAKDLKAVQTEEVGPSLLPRLGLAKDGTNAALVVEFKTKDGKAAQTLLLGKKHMRKSNRPSPYGDMGEEGFPDGRYVKSAASETVAIISDPLNTVEPRPESWLNKDFFKIEKVKTIAVEFPVITNSWKLTRDTEAGEWKLAEMKSGEDLDSSKVSGFANALASPSFTDVVVDPATQALGLDKPSAIQMETFDGFAYSLKLGSKTGESFPLVLAVSAQLPKERTPGKDEKPEDKERLDKEFKETQKKLQDKLDQEKKYEGWTYLVSAWSFENLLKERSQLMVEKKAEDASTNAPPESIAAPVLLPGQ